MVWYFFFDIKAISIELSLKHTEQSLKYLLHLNKNTCNGSNENYRAITLTIGRGLK